MHDNNKCRYSPQPVEAKLPLIGLYGLICHFGSFPSLARSAKLGAAASFGDNNNSPTGSR
jgi:hypothetical protein